MAKRTDTPPRPAPDAADEALLELAEMLLGDFFFDPDNEDLYKQALSENRPQGTEGALLDEDKIDLPDATARSVSRRCGPIQDFASVCSSGVLRHRRRHLELRQRGTAAKSSSPGPVIRTPSKAPWTP